MNYEIKGEPMPVVICALDEDEPIVCEAGAMAWMSPNMEMKTSAGALRKVFGRIFSGESMFRNTYTPRGGAGTIAFASSFPGAIRAVEITPDHPVIAQKSAFLASSGDVEMSVFFQKKFLTGLFGGEGFIMQKFTGTGTVFLEIDGSAMEYDLADGEQLVIDTGYLAMVSETCQIDVRSVKGFKNVLFGGEGLVNTVVTGPGRVVLQTMPLSNFAQAISPYLSTASASVSSGSSDSSSSD